jgi:polygalacturonase
MSGAAGGQQALASEGGRRTRKAPPGALFDAAAFGASGDGQTAATGPLQRAIDACAAAGGGTVVVPPGRYLSGALTLRSHVHLHLAPGAVLLGSERPQEFPPLKGRHEGIERTLHSSLINGLDLEDVSISGPGVISAQGEWWWRADETTRQLRQTAKLPREADNPPAAPTRWPSPRVVGLIRCKGVTIADLTIEDGPSYNIQLVYCEDVLLDGVTTRQRRPVQGTDGIIVDSSRKVRIANCSISSGADCIGLKSGYNEDGRRVNLPTEHVLITNCELHGGGGSGVGIGSETAGSVRDVLVSNCVFADCFRGVFIRSPRGRGGVVERVRVSDVIMNGLQEMAVKVTHYYDSVRMEGRYIREAWNRHNLETARSRVAPVDVGTPTFRNLSFSGLSLGKVREVAQVEGLPERYISQVTFQDISVTDASAGISLVLTSDVTVSNLSVVTMEGPALDAREVQRLEVHRLRYGKPQLESPVVWLGSVTGAFIHGCHVPDPGGGFQWLRQEQCKAVVLGDNHTPGRPADVGRP